MTAVVLILCGVAIGCGVTALLFLGWACLAAASDADDRVEEAEAIRQNVWDGWPR